MKRAFVQLLSVGIVLAGTFAGAVSACAQTVPEAGKNAGQPAAAVENVVVSGNSAVSGNAAASGNAVTQGNAAGPTGNATATGNRTTGTGENAAGNVRTAGNAGPTGNATATGNAESSIPAAGTAGQEKPVAEAPKRSADGTLKFGDETFSPEEQQAALKAFGETYAWLDRLIAEHDRLTEELAKAVEEKDETRVRELSDKQHQVMVQVHTLYRKARKLIEPAWMADPQNEAVRSFMLFLLASALEEDQYEIAYNIVREMMAKKAHLTDPVLYELAGITSFMMNKYDVARLCFNEALRKEKLTAAGGACKEQLPYYLDAWKTEQALREAEAKKGDNPRVLLQTTKGDVVVELFEDNAPNTVANFIALVERGFYTNCNFHTVISGFMAQTGSPLVNGTGNPGYCIPDEYDRPDVRKHFRGSLSMAHTAEPDSSGSQFFVMLVPAQHLDGKYTVFGRVVSGMEVIASLERTDTTQIAEDGSVRADRILQAKVLRKRNHVYEPKTLPLP